MKKHLYLIAASVTGMGAPCVNAQTSATVFGVLDLAVQSLRADGLGSATRLSSGSNQPSRIGFRGTEDLGSGLKAGFWLEGTIAADSGLGGSNNTNNQSTGAVAAGGLQFDRRSTLSLSNAAGELRIGRDYVPTYWNASRADPFTANGVGSDRNLIGAGAVSAPTWVRASNSVGYHLPENLGGIYGQAMVAWGENLSGAANKNDGQYTGARLGYAKGPVDMALATGKTRYRTGDFQLTNLFGSYNFGPVKVSALWNGARLDTPTPQKQRDFLLAAVVPVGAGQFDLSYVKSRITSSPTGAGASQVALGYLHNLSKRTAPYIHYARIRNQGGATFSNGPGAPTAGGTTSGLEVGVRHFF